MITAKTSKDLKPVLMQKDAPALKNPYYLIEDGGQCIFVVSSGRSGAEFNKTAGYFSDFPGMQTYISLYGSGLMLMQRNEKGGEAKEFKVVTLNPLKQITVPAGWAMCLVNTSSSGYLVVLRSNALEEKFIDEKPITSKGGLAYFVVEKKGEIGFEQNPNYQIHPQIATE